MNWQPLESGSIVDIIAPAARASDNELNKGIDYLKGLGLVPRVPHDLLQKDFVFANTNEYRLNHLVEALTCPDSKAIWCLRGGSGCLHLLPLLGRIQKPQKQKLFIGLSDITALHLFLNQQWGWQTLHAPVLARMKEHSPIEEKDEIEDVLFGRKKEICFELEPLNESARVQQKVSASIIGGNLTVAHTTLGSPYTIQGDGNILFFEDIGERGYKIDRTLESMRQAGIFKNAKAIIFGDFVGGSEPDGKNYGEQALTRFANSLEIPVLTGIESGHGLLQRPIFLNGKSTLTMGLSPVLTCFSR